jgi:hypothetical protein
MLFSIFQYWFTKIINKYGLFLQISNIKTQRNIEVFLFIHQEQNYSTSCIPNKIERKSFKEKQNKLVQNSKTLQQLYKKNLLIWL